MAFVHVQTKQQSPTAATTNTSTTSLAESFSSLPAVGNLLIMYIAYNVPLDVGARMSSVTDNQGGNTWAIAREDYQASNAIGSAIAWCVPTISSGTFTVTANFIVGQTLSAAVGISEFSGNSPAKLDTVGGNQGTGVTPDGGSIAPTVSSELFISMLSIAAAANQTITIPSGWDGKRSEQNTTAAAFISSASKIATDSASQGSAWTITSAGAGWTCTNACFKPGGVRLLASLGVGN